MNKHCKQKIKHNQLLNKEEVKKTKVVLDSYILDMINTGTKFNIAEQKDKDIKKSK